MTGDGTNDAPALAQADVGVAMNTGTSAAKEAGNMVDLDSDPTKLIEIVEIGKQLLITRGSLTTFSIANDVAKYFAIIPAMFVALYPGLDALNVMRLHSPDLGDPVGGDLQRADHRRADPAGAARRALPAGQRRRDALPQPLPLRHRRAVAPFLGIKLIDLLVQFLPGVSDMATRLPSWVRQHLAAVRALLVLTVLLGLAYPLAITAVAQIPGLRSRADGSLVDRDGRDGRRLPADRPVVHRRRRQRAAAVLPVPPVGGRRRLRPDLHLGVQPRPGGRRRHPTAPGRSLLTQVCARSTAVGELEGVDGSRPYCTPAGVGAVLAVFHAGPGYAGPVTRAVSVNQYCGRPTPFLAEYEGVRVECHRAGEDVSRRPGRAVRGDAPATPAVPADAVTASGSGLDPHISPAYAGRPGAPGRPRARPPARTGSAQLVRDNTTGRALGFLGEPGVNVLELNLALDRTAAVGP